VCVSKQRTSILRMHLHMYIELLGGFTRTVHLRSYIYCPSKDLQQIMDDLVPL